MPRARALGGIVLVVALAGCAAGTATAPDSYPTRATDFRPSELRQAAVMIRVVVDAGADVAEEDRKDAGPAYEGALLEALDGRALLVRDVRTITAGQPLPPAPAAAAHAREVGAGHALVVDVRVEPAAVRVCEETRRPLQGRATMWRQVAQVVRASDSAVRLQTEAGAPAVEAECDGTRPTVRPRDRAATIAAAVEALAKRLLGP